MNLISFVQVVRAYYQLFVDLHNVLSVVLTMLCRTGVFPLSKRVGNTTVYISIWRLNSIKSITRNCTHPWSVKIYS